MKLIQKDDSRVSDALRYREILVQVKTYSDKIGYIRGFSEVSVAKFEFVKRNTLKMLDYMS